MAKILVDSLPEGFRSHFSKRLVDYSEDGRNIVTMTFADGTTAEADILIGADGVKSLTREKMYRDLAKAAEQSGDSPKAKQLEDFILPSWTGTYAYRSLVETEKLMKARPGHQAASTPLMVSLSQMQRFSNDHSASTSSTSARVDTSSHIPYHAAS